MCRIPAKRRDREEQSLHWLGGEWSKQAFPPCRCGNLRLAVNVLFRPVQFPNWFANPLRLVHEPSTYIPWRQDRVTASGANPITLFDTAHRR